MYQKNVRITNEYGEDISEKTFTYKGKFDNAEGYAFWSGKNYVKCFSDIEYPKELTDSEIGKLARLSKKIYGKTNMLGYRGNNGTKAYSDEDISKILGLKIRQGKKFLNKMIKLGIMTKSISKERIEYYFSPVYFFSANRINLEMYEKCREPLDKVLFDWVKERYQLLQEEPIEENKEMELI